MNKKVMVFTAVGVALTALYLVAAKPEPVARELASDSERRIETGLLVGYSDRSETHAYRGIPFAKPPVGDLRWKPPGSPESWSGTREALANGNSCVQLGGPLSGVTPSVESGVVGSEDCLYLNLWAPHMTPQAVNQQARKLPVMVWIHGGGNTIGAASTYNGSNLAGSQQVIVVALNYRLGLFGWFGHPALRAASESAFEASGNYGTLDIIQGLKWVKNNISAFGGDPDNVTIFGESAGGLNVFSLMGSKPAEGLFDRAIVQSGGLLTMSRSMAENYLDDESLGMDASSREVINHLLIAEGRAGDRSAAKALQQTLSEAEVVELLRSRTAEQLLAHFVEQGASQAGMYLAPALLRDGVVLPKEHLLERFTDTQQYNSVPVMLGANRDEIKMFMVEDPRLVSNFLGVFPQIIDQQVYDRQSHYISNQWRASGVDEPARVLQQSQGDSVFAYRFDWDEAPSGWPVDIQKLLGASHGLEIDFIFDDFERSLMFPMAYDDDNAPGRLKLSKSMMEYWAEFAYRGHPGKGVSGNNTLWQSWASAEGDFLMLDSDSDGGIRMSGESFDNRVIKKQLLADKSFSSQEEHCRLYVWLFDNPEQNEDLWDSEEYANLGAEGCAAYPKDAFPSLI